MRTVPNLSTPVDSFVEKRPPEASPKTLAVPLCAVFRLVDEFRRRVAKGRGSYNCPKRIACGQVHKSVENERRIAGVALQSFDLILGAFSVSADARLPEKNFAKAVKFYGRSGRTNRHFERVMDLRA
jgi:hypothetical protein